MPSPPRKGWWSRVRRLLRWLRLAVLSLILVVLGGLIYLNRVGIPDFLRARLVAELRARGLDLQFSRMRLHWYRGLVAEDLNLGRTRQPFGPQLYIDLMELRLSPQALRRFEFQVDSLLIRQGRLVWPLSATNRTARTVSVDNLSTELRFLPNDQWELDRFQADCLGARLQLTGTLTNASSVRDWNYPRATNQVAALSQNRLSDWVEALEKIKFQTPPDIHIALQGDARAPASFNARIIASTRAVRAPQLQMSDVLLVARLNQPPATNSEIHSELLLRADGVRTPWGRAREGRFTAQLTARPDRAGVSHADWQLQLVRARSSWASTDRLQANGQTRRATTNENSYLTTLEMRTGPIQTRWGSAKSSRLAGSLRNERSRLTPTLADGNLQLTGAQSPWGNADQLRLAAHSTRAPASPPVRADPSWAGWARLAPYWIDWEAAGDGFKSERIAFRHLDGAGQWRPPDLTLNRLQAELYDGRLEAEAGLNVATRRATAAAVFDFDPRQAEAAIVPAGQSWLRDFTWKKPPRVQIRATALLPAWTEHDPDWRKVFLPTLAAAGDLALADAEYRGVPIDTAKSRFTLTNLVWTLPNLVVAGPAGRAEVAYQGRLFSPAFQGSVTASIHPAALSPLLAQAQRKAFDLFQFHEPPWIQGQVRGEWSSPSRLGFAARIAATNFVFRAEECSRLAAAIRYTNQFVTATDVQIRHGEQTVSAPAVGFDVPRERLYLTNVSATIDPMVVARAIGPNTAHSLAPYHFERPPTARVNGSLRVHAPETPDLRFELSGGPFQYWRFHLPQVASTVLWQGDWIILTNFDGAFYGGRLLGDAGFDLGAAREADFHFRADVFETSLKLLVSDLRASTNRLEGTLNGNLTVTAANTADWESWNGFGDARLRDGYLWNLPLFGIFSPVLNAVVPGLGNSRFTEGSAAFTITNSVIHTDRLETHSPALRLYYKGTVDFHGRVNARAEASLLRDAWLVGQLFSLALSPLTKVFEYKVTGTLEDPKSDPLYVPKFLLLPLHPFRTLKNLLVSPAGTNAPPAKPRSP